MRFRIFVSLSLLLFCVQAEAGLYFYKDEAGTLHGVDSPDLIPAKYKAGVKQLDSYNSTKLTAINVPITKKNNHILVEVTFNGKETAVMVLDTGASSSMISKSLQTRLNLASNGTSKINSASSTVEVPMVTLESVAIQEFSRGNLRVAVNDVPGFSAIGVDGLLGLDFLGFFKIQIDTKSDTLRLERQVQ